MSRTVVFPIHPLRKWFVASVLFGAFALSIPAFAQDATPEATPAADAAAQPEATLAPDYAAESLALRPTGGEPGTFTEIPCPADAPAGAQCGYVTVAARYDEPEGDVLQISVARVPASQPATDVPLFFLTGGPGEIALPTYLAIAPAFAFNDMILMDQRSVGLSEPTLQCPEYDALLTSTEGFDQSEEAIELAFNTLEACGQGFAEQGVDLSLITTTETAHDVATVTQALGYDQINLFGVSYGTRLAQRVLALHPEIINAAVLDSVIPPQVDRPAETVRSVAESLSRVFEACAADEACNAAYPDLEAVYNEVYATLNETQPTVSLTYREQSYDIPLTGDLFQAVVFNSLYAQPGIAELPSLTYAMRDGDYARLNESFGWQFVQAVATGVNFQTFFAVECQGEIAFGDPAALEAVFAEFPQWEETLGAGAGISGLQAPELCATWGAQPAEGENDPVTFDGPVLLLAGEFDPVTPPRLLEAAAEGLSDSTVVDLAGASHAAALSGECGYNLVVSFLIDPTAELDTACAAQGSLVFNTP